MKEDNFGELCVEYGDDNDDWSPKYCAICGNYLTEEDEEHCGILCFDCCEEVHIHSSVVCNVDNCPHMLKCNGYGRFDK